MASRAEHKCSGIGVRSAWLIEIHRALARSSPVENKDLVGVGAARVRLTADSIEVSVGPERQALGSVEIAAAIAGVRVIAGEDADAARLEVVAKYPAEVLENPSR